MIFFYFLTGYTRVLSKAGFVNGGNVQEILKLKALIKL